MPVLSPLVRNSLELLGHAVEHYVGGSPRDRRIAVQLLWQSCELAAKDVLVRDNRPIVGPDGKFLGGRVCVAKVGEAWGVGTTPHLAELDLLRDERNAIQHRYGTIDEFTMDYYVEIAFAFVSEVLDRQGADLHQYLRNELHDSVWRACRFIQDEQEQRVARARALTSSTPGAGLLDAFSALENATLEKAATHGIQPVSTLDLLMKFGTALIEQGKLPRESLRELADVYRLRNDAVRSDIPPSVDRVMAAIDTIAPFLEALGSEMNIEAFVDALAKTRTKEVQEEPPISERPSMEQILRLIARRQLRYRPPQFVGLNLLANEFGAHEQISEMIEGGLIVVYKVPNPHSAFPTSAVRVNLGDGDVVNLLGQDLVSSLGQLNYGEGT